MGKSPHSGGESRFFPDACSGIPERGTERRRREPERQKDKGEVQSREASLLVGTAPGNTRDGQAEGSRQVCSRQQGQALGMTKGCRD